MSSNLVLRPEAVTDLREAYVWYEAERTGLGRAFLRRVRQQLDLICENPRCYPTVLKSVRRAPLRRFPFGIYYEEQGSRTVVLAVYHFKRSPDGWKSRI
jgi:toxin ParE1/3/4